MLAGLDFPATVRSEGVAMEGSWFSGMELAERARVAPELVARLVELGILRPGDGGAGFGPGDVRRVRLVDACARAGLTLEGIGAAIASGRLSLAFLDLVTMAGRPLTDTTYAELCAQEGLSMELVQRVHEASGLGRPEPDDPVHPLDRDLLGSARLGRMLGLDDGVLIRVARVYGENLRRVAQAEPEFYHDHVEGPLLASGMDERQMREAASRMSDQLAGVVQRMLVALYTRHQERYTIDHLVEHIESVVTERRPQRPPAMCFLDLAGYTHLTEERGDRAAAALVTSLADLVERVSFPHDGQPVKWLGDGVMFHFRRPAQAVVAALEMVERTPAAGLPPAHVGLHAGPVVFQDGDYFGRTVNLAARIAGRAGPGEVLVSDQVVAECGGGGVGFEPIGPVPLKGVSDPVPLHRATRQG
jgi:adenylate cyclase